MCSTHGLLLSGSVRLWASDNELLEDGIDGDGDGDGVADADEIVNFVQFEGDQFVTIVAGTIKTFILKADTTGVSSSMDDTVRFDVMDETAAVDGNEFQWDAPTVGIVDRSGTGVPYLPVIGGTLVY
ncbi:hypothetical protein A3B21_01215 [Candidatus Uhrbacteria bacterium RIFCSPLOWO2_01_FULL_47_24]|uniref:Uncharacterized protein n=1 Tax=Candidatus Uhrbacteria bacterium RIFCSPLOWO2_01_FULL_47_24 TaxID=1802401 RepID=A0A1F7UTH2_9BACT|nr:MAG: hypothetical protein A3D58_00975 [Candidatus Uhrbacteria bacterium RIFCSPHIGHO2_02_FULL_46_47]OGL75665.1 MAG: hypothetical protein A3F52_04670 [Candidatus Uhrbacteria bacterium RIFCSPHIGHO2_12_FULL_47_11]OGL81014.1 MAG: hypothetical protein A3B21_01215 [Candidatus Uhrbacteria bacterium RIFCSPLOWO2_01_FULL_47_24]OGL84315.1 MAG: hypothetical protein A3J03_00275 [Candidatus Uhrbacteria bacterium RIFCSPLOWO2_02_FULL_46_25]OGL92117.1 MAG: hypothetical protein A3H11_00865 [Candidatus Uhrbacte